MVKVTLIIKAGIAISNNRHFQCCRLLSGNKKSIVDRIIICIKSALHRRDKKRMEALFFQGHLVDNIRVLQCGFLLYVF